MSQASDPGPTRQYNLRSRFQLDMLELLESESCSDVVFTLDGTFHGIRAHSSVIAVRCKSLRTRVVCFLEERKTGVRDQDADLTIHVGAVSEETFCKVLTYVYTGTIALEADDVYDVCCLSGFLGMDSLQSIVFSYLQSQENIHQIATVLDQVLANAEENYLLLAKLTQYFAENCSKVLKRAPLEILSREFMLHLVKQENLSASEIEIWDSLVTWCCGQCGISPPRKVSAMLANEQRRVARHIQSFCRPGYVRVLNFDATAFAREVEPLRVFPQSEVLLKYRFEATAGTVGFDNAFPLDRYNFLTRCRQRTMCFESNTHPHPRGVSQTFEVQLPVWVSQTKVVFDPRTALGRYADLELFADDGRTQRIFSLRANRQSRFYAVHGNVKLRLPPIAEPSSLEPIYISGNSFWVSFYAPQNVGDLAWGYKFFVSIVR